MFTFIHAADLHLDSPLIGLKQRASEQAARIENASRSAFDALIRLAIAENAAFMVLAGDVFDGHWRDYRTGVFFAERMAKLREAGIAVYVIRGNHDAENRFMQRLTLSENVHILGAKAPETRVFPALGVAVHGQSYAQRDITENLATQYPAPLPGLFNIGLLHTACTGRDGHATYAPCTVDQLVQRGYDYWALGHVHAHEVLHTGPHVVFSGNLQGRSVRETGPKGAVVVRVADGRVTSAEHRALDSVRWSVVTPNVTGLRHKDDLLAAIRRDALVAADEAGERALVLRVNVAGQTALHDQLVSDGEALRDEVQTLFAGLSGEVWMEKLGLHTEREAKHSRADPSVLGELERAVTELALGVEGDPAFERVLAEIAPKLPGWIKPEELLARLRAELPTKARDLALALLGKGRG